MLLERAIPGSYVTIVIRMDVDGTERTEVFSTPITAKAWADQQDDDCTCIIVEPMIVDVPEFGNEMESTNAA